MSRRCLFLLLVSGISGTAGAQDKHSMGTDPTCRCRIVLRHVTTLGREADTIALLQQSTVTMDSRRQFYVAPVLPNGAIALYDSAGRFRSMFGRQGSGPGEMMRIRDVVLTSGDSAIAYDGNRFAMFGPDGTHVRTASMEAGPRGFRFVAFRNGSLLLNNYFPTHPAFSLLQRDFRIVREFGRSVGGDRLGSDALLFHIADVGNGHFVGVQQNYRFGLQVWDTTGRMLREIQRQPDWFPPWTRADRETAGFGPLPVVLGVHFEAARRRLWIIASVPDRNWKSPPPRSRAAGVEGGGSPPIPVSASHRAYDTVIEVLDMESNRVLISQRFDESFPYLMESGLVYGYREHPTGMLVIDVYRPEIISERPGDALRRRD